jgi:hypothetical protein
MLHLPRYLGYLMKRHGLSVVSATVVLGLTVLSARVVAQQAALKERLVGTWMLTEFTGERADGGKFEPFGADPKGIVIFTSDGHFSLFQSKAQVPRIASDDRDRATPEEATGVIRASIAYYGAYSVNDDAKTVSLVLDGSTFANLIGGPEQTRMITLLSAEELRLTNPRTPSGVPLQSVWKRAAIR